jgi:hypothetical protein
MPKRPLFPGEFTWRLNDEPPAKRKKRSDGVKRIRTQTRPLYPGESTWSYNVEQIVERKKRIAHAKRQRSANYRQQVKADNEALNVKREMETLAVTGERYVVVYLQC